MDYITIKNLKIFAHHGVFEQETENGQNFYVNAKLYVDMERAGTTDALDDAVNYGEVCLFLESFLKEHTYKLLEQSNRAAVKMAMFAAIVLVLFALGAYCLIQKSRTKSEEQQEQLQQAL
mgnify:CR=1 FL=1